MPQSNAWAHIVLPLMLRSNLWLLSLVTPFLFTCPRTLAQSSAGNAALRHLPRDADAVYAPFRHIPPDADAVFHVDLAAIFSKTSPDALESATRQTGADGWVRPFLSTLQQGIDLNSDLYFAVSNKYHSDSPVYTTVIYPLSDAAKFIASLRSQVMALRPPDQHTGSQVMTSSSIAVAWDNRHAVVVTREPSIYGPKMYSTDVIRDINYRRALAAWRGFPNSYFMTDPDFKSAFSEKADAHIWNRHGAGYSGLRQLFRMTPIGDKLGQLVQYVVAGSREHTMGILRFASGKIAYRHIRMMTPQEAASVNPPFNPMLLAGAPFGNIIGAATIHFNPAALPDTLGHSPDLPAALEGDCLLLAYEAGADQHNAAILQMPDIFAVFSVKDTAAFIRLASFYKLTDATTAPDVDSSYHTPFHYYALHNGIAVVTTTPQMAENYFTYSASASNPTGRVLSTATPDGSFSLGLDMGKVADFLVNLAKGADESMVERARLLAAIYQKMGVFSVSAGHVVGKGLATDFEVSLADPQKNGLAGALEIFSDFHKGLKLLH